jgi:glucokinase
MARAEERPVLAVDLGGTKMIIALVSRNGWIIERHYWNTVAVEGPRAVIERVFEGIDYLLGENGLAPQQLSAVSIAAAAIIDMREGIITAAPNLPDWENIPLKSIVLEKYGIDTYLINDADAAALGEHRFGAGKGLNNLVLLTLGTGIGGGIIIDGKLYTGSYGGAAELGHMIIVEDGPECGCGNKGCLEALASGTAIAREARRRIVKGEKSSLAELAQGKQDDITAETVYLAAKDGDQLSLDVITGAARYLGKGVLNLVHIFSPDMVILGGSVARMGDLLFEPVRRIVGEQAFPLMAKSVQIVPARLGNDAGVVGAAVYTLEH